MQNKYVGDMGDFGKFGLLRWLCGMREDVASDGLGRPKLGVVWYLNKNDDRNDGKIRDYLEDLSSTFYLCDIDLFAALKQTLQPEHRSINFLRKSEFILPGAKFYRECVHCYSGKVSGELNGYAAPCVRWMAVIWSSPTPTMVFHWPNGLDTVLSTLICKNSRSFLSRAKARAWSYTTMRPAKLLQRKSSIFLNSCKITLSFLSVHCGTTGELQDFILLLSTRTMREF